MFDLDLDEVEEQSSSYEMIPNGTYDVMITEIDDKETKAGNGNYLRMRFDVISENHNGRCFFINYNYINPNETAQNIGRSDIKKLAGAIGLSGKVSQSDYMEKALTVRLTGKKNGEYENYTIVEYMKHGGGLVVKYNASKDSIDIPF